MKKLVMLVASAALVFAVSCDKKKSGENSEKESSVKEQVVDSADSGDSEWVLEGEYAGVLPCADCSGIKTKIVLKEDGTFEKSEEYLEKDNGLVESKGTFEWDKTGGVITLKDEKGNVQLYKVDEGVLIMLGSDGKEVEGELADSYVLSKVE